MATFFSGTDINTLNIEGKERPFFLSLIVNNEGTYNAKLARKNEVINTININKTYKNFKDKVKETKEVETIQEVTIDIFDTNITIEGVQNIELLDRIKEIQKEKELEKSKIKSIPNFGSFNNLGNRYYDKYVDNYKPKIKDNNIDNNIKNINLKDNSINNKENTDVLPFSNNVIDDVPSFSNFTFTVNEDEVTNMLVQLLSGSLIVFPNKSVPLLDLVKNIDRRYDNRFKNDDFMYFIDNIITLLLEEYGNKIIVTSEDIESLDIVSAACEVLIEELTNLNISINSKVVDYMITCLNGNLI